MAAKTRNAKTKAKRAAPKAKAKTAKKAPRAKAKPKRKATPIEKRGRQTAAAAPAPTDDAAETKRGPLARLADGVGSLFARMTGKKPDPPPARSPEQTMELGAGDILAMTPEPPPTPKPKS